MGESDVPQINCMFIIGQLIHHAYSSMSGPHALQLFINPIMSYNTVIQGACPEPFFFSGDTAIPQCLPHFKVLNSTLQ